MLTFWEKIIFLAVLMISAGLSIKSFRAMFESIARGPKPLQWNQAKKRLWQGVWMFLSQKSLFKTRPLTGFIHALVAWGFTLYMLVNLLDILQGFVPSFHFFPNLWIGKLFRLFVDIFSVLILAGVLFFLIRRFIFNAKNLSIHEPVLVSDKTKLGVRIDSAIVGFFILFHVGFRFLGASLEIALNKADAYQVAASLAANLWLSYAPESLDLLFHISWWIALGLILVFVPYFPYSKHAHLFMGPINYMFKVDPKISKSIDRLDLEDEKIEQFGARLLEHLPQKSLLDSYACIMCNRCQDRCPAYTTGKPLSPSALEVNKRYQLKNVKGFSAGAASTEEIRKWMINDEGVWSCTTCGYCMEVCPVGNEPMRDVINIRQDLVLMQSDFPQEGVTTFKNFENNGNPWGIARDGREKWTEGLDVPLMRDKPDAEYLFWVGCAGSYDDRAIKTSKAMINILNKAGVSYAILGNEETCTGDSARRMGNEYLFQMMAGENIKTLDRYKTKKILTGCPHCFNTLKNEYPSLNGNYEVSSHIDFIEKLLTENKISIKKGELGKMSYHDSCYLGRFNGIYEAPRRILGHLGGKEKLVELKQNHSKSFCCGAGGGRMWQEEKIGSRINEERCTQVKESNIDTIGVLCPFCNIMLTDGCNSLELKTQVKDIALLVSESLD